MIANIVVGGGAASGGVVVVVVVTYYRIGRLEGGQLALVVVEAMFVQREGRLGRHGGGVRMAA